MVWACERRCHSPATSGYIRIASFQFCKTEAMYTRGELDTAGAVLYDWNLGHTQSWTWKTVLHDYYYP